MHKALRELKPSGQEGLEGLIAKLLSALTNRHFYLARSGSQGGRDMSTGGESTNWIAVECKRYQEDTSLNDRELLGELEEAYLTISGLDVWVLVASRSVPEQLRTILNQSAQEKGMEVVIIETKDNSPSSLAVLCAQGKEILIQHLKDYGLSQDDDTVNSAVECIARQPNYTIVLEKLQNSFSPAVIGYDNWRSVQNAWLLECFKSESQSRAIFGQVLNVNDETIKVIKRKSAWIELDNWLNSWSQNPTSFVLLGEEGDGKTWAIASWLIQKLQSESFPPSIFLTPQQVTSYDLKELLLTSAIASQLKLDNRVLWKQFWGIRLDNWMKRAQSSFPTMLLILDDANRYDSYKLRLLMEKLDSAPWKGRIAVIITCRTITWKERFSYLTHLSVRDWTLQPYNEEELSLALAQHGLTTPDIHPSLLPLISKPRYFDLVLELRQDILKSRDITVQRLIYEDWRSRFSKKTEYSSMSFYNEDFNLMLRNLAERVLYGKQSFTDREIDEALPLYSERKKVFEELTSGGILIRNAQGNYIVEDNRLIHGFGLILAELVREKLPSGEQTIEEAIASLLEPHPDMDVKARICGAAVLYVVMSDSFPEQGKFALFRAWLGNRNLDAEGLDALSYYTPRCPETYINLTEYFSSEKHENPEILELLKSGFLRWYDRDQVREVLIKAIERWMGFIHPYGSRPTRGVRDERAEKHKQEISERLGYEPKSGPINFAGYDLTIVEDDGLLRLARFALAIISQKPRSPYVKALVNWAVAREIMGYPDEYELVKWVLRTAPDEIWKKLKPEIEKLIAKGHIVTQRAAYRMLYCEGSADAYSLLETLPDDLFPPHPALEIYKEDPCKQKLFLWSREDYKHCTDREDIDAGHIARRMRDLSLEPNIPIPSNLSKRLEELEDVVSPDSVWKTFGLTAEDHFLEEIEPALCAFSPYTFAQIVRSIIRDAPNRDGMALRQLSLLHLKDNLLILESSERDAIYKAWRELHKRTKEWEETEQIAEEFMFHVVLDSLPAEKQLEHFLSRPEKVGDLIDYEHHFKVPEPKFWDDIILDISNIKDEKRLRRIIWFISANTKDAPVKVIDTIIQYLKHSCSLIRQLVLFTLFQSERHEKVKEIINGSWTWAAHNREGENYWGSRLLCEYGANLPYEEIHRRIYPPLLAYAVYKRGLRSEEVSKYAEDLDIIWRRIYERGGLALDDDFPVGKSPFTSGPIEFYPSFLYVLKHIIKTRPDLIEKWIQGISSKTSVSGRLLFFCKSFYASVCASLFEIDPLKGVELFKEMKSSSKDIFAVYAVQSGDEHPDVAQLWRNMIGECNTDFELLELAMIVQQKGQISWLNKIINDGLDSPKPLERARATVLQGFLEDDEVGASLEKQLHALPKSWIRSVSEYSLQNWQRNKWAKHWFLQYLEEKDNVKAWAAFKLFLKCVDRRFFVNIYAEILVN